MPVCYAFPIGIHAKLHTPIPLSGLSEVIAIFTNGRRCSFSIESKSHDQGFANSFRFSPKELRFCSSSTCRQLSLKEQQSWLLQPAEQSCSLQQEALDTGEHCGYSVIVCYRKPKRAAKFCKPPKYQNCI